MTIPDPNAQDEAPVPQQPPDEIAEGDVKPLSHEEIARIAKLRAAFSKPAEEQLDLPIG